MTLSDILVIPYLHRWTAIGYPQRITSQVEAVAIQHVEDEQHFHKIQLADQNNFEEHLDSLQVSSAFFLAK